VPVPALAALGSVHFLLDRPLEWAARGLALSAAGRPSAYVRDVERGQVAARLLGHAGQINAIASSSPGRLLATAAADGTAKCFDLRSPLPAMTLAGHAFPLLSVAFGK
jgi:WD40 repeat protein